MVSFAAIRAPWGRLRRYGEARGWTTTEYVDAGVSGAKDRRPALDALLRDAKQRRFDVLVCWRLDRLGRNLRHLVTLIEDLSSLGIGFVTLNEGIDTTTPTGRLQLHVLAALAEFERARIAERDTSLASRGCVRQGGAWVVREPSWPRPTRGARRTCRSERPLSGWVSRGRWCSYRRLSGIFAFVLYDQRTNDFLIARDPLGVVPLYLGRDECGNLHAASEMKALIRFCRHIEDSPPGHYLTRGLEKPARYHDPPWRSYDAVEDTPLEIPRLRAALESAIHQPLMCGVPSRSTPCERSSRTACRGKWCGARRSSSPTAWATAGSTASRPPRRSV